MARIAGVNIPTQKRVEIGLRYIYGIGPVKSKEICDSIGIEASRRVHQPTETVVCAIVRSCPFVVNAPIRMLAHVRVKLSQLRVKKVK